MRERKQGSARVFIGDWVWFVWMSHCARGVWRGVITFTEEAGEGLFLNSVHLFWSLLPLIMIKSLPRGNIWYLMWTCHTHFQSWGSFVLDCILLLFFSLFFPFFCEWVLFFTMICVVPTYSSVQTRMSFHVDYVRKIVGQISTRL